MIHGFESPGPSLQVIREFTMGYDRWCEYLREVLGPLPALAPLSLLTRPELSLQDYHLAIAGEGPLALDWEDKPHRLVYDLCREIQALRERS